MSSDLTSETVTVVTRHYRPGPSVGPSPATWHKTHFLISSMRAFGRIVDVIRSIICYNQKSSANLL